MARTEREVHLHDPQTLYRHWEDEQWSPFAIDLHGRPAQWAEMAGEDRSLVLWALSSLMVAEERITTKFSGLVGAYGTEEEATFLATQQVDEARHMQFYARFQDEVIADPAGDRRPRRARPRAALAGVLRRSSTRRWSRPTSGWSPSRQTAGAKVDFVTTYHMVIEGTLGLTAFNFIVRYLERESLLARVRRGLLEDPPRRAAPHRLRHLVPARGGPRRRRRSADNVRADAARAASRGRPGADPAGPRGHRLGRARRERGGDPRLRGLGPLQAAQHRRGSARLPVTRGAPEASPDAPPPRDSPRSRSSSRAAGPSSPTQHAHGGLGAVGVALVFGLVIMVMVYATGHLSGAHINPAVTVAFTLTRHFPRPRRRRLHRRAARRRRRRGALLLLAMWTDQPAGLGATVPTVGAGQRARLRDRPDRLSDVRDHGRGDRRARGRRRGRDRDRRHRGARRPVRRAGHGREHEPGPLLRPRARGRRVDRLLDLRRRSARRRGLGALAYQLVRGRAPARRRARWHACFSSASTTPAARR